jgi:hypothetical protein
MNKFAQKAKQVTEGGDNLFANRTRIKMENLIAAYPNGVLVTEFRKLKGPKGDFWLVGFAEDPACCFSATSVVEDILNSWIDGYETVAAASDDLKKNGGCKLKLYYKTGKSGNQYVAVDVIG